MLSLYICPLILKISICYTNSFCTIILKIYRTHGHSYIDKFIKYSDCINRETYTLDNATIAIKNEDKIVATAEMAKLYEKTKFHILTKEEYIDIVIEQLELLRPEIVIHRITGDPKLDDLVEPEWLVKKFCVLNDIDKEMVKRNTYQGKRHKKRISN